MPQKYTRVVVSNRAHDSKQVVPRSKIILPLPAGISQEKKIPSIIKFMAKLSVDNLWKRDKKNKMCSWLRKQTNKQEVHADLIKYLTVWVQKSLLNWCICEKEKNHTTG